MPTANDLPEVLETTEPERLATGFIFYRRAAVASGRQLWGDPAVTALIDSRGKLTEAQVREKL